MDFAIELVQFLMSRKKYWLVPVMLIFLLLGTVLFVTSGTAAAPFIYTLF